ncbi:MULTISPECIES: sirohydrochlorin chelatase [Streptomycetaceae]|uniref:Metal binding protein n=1 Tax=Streptantibioticus cattleyicolor (strain ATCC 35852 / DSM 46488 / JCM 4925 / NBRC 14057 / NRRL 8057) TaxID=1003195 RepID=F8JY31_STREN|nr:MULTISPECIES: sirohydrochlorin chelatase [Streptomycetaceae]AEW93420.1 metal binding protein [Streptantibioticus cattleyicolor NRRL 8057 = DSM 46488]MYS58133.1 sirohydrochlorin chelatase [Streptomyces sp. SID5468]CCB73775.1 putative metal binding protein [Streptantibioticus cattleyicolor NRRL 8057 = DSM 46488]
MTSSPQPASDAAAPQPPAPALLLVGHGTRDEAGAEAFRSFVRELGERNPQLPVGGGFIELSPPPLADAVAELVERGVRRFAAVPLVLVSAGHAKGDIPAALAREERRHPGTSYAYGRPLGPHPGLLKVLERRLDEALGESARTPADRARTTVLLVGRGSTDPDANAEVFKVARLLWEGRGYANVETAFVSLAAPDVPSGLDRCARLGAERIVVLPYFLFTGVLPDRVRQQAQGWADAHPEVEVRHADVIGPTEELVELVMERYRETLTGDLRMNCDSCVYRIALPGFEERVGMPQQPHHHPDDPSHGHGHHDHGHVHSH